MSGAEGAVACSECGTPTERIEYDQLTFFNHYEHMLTFWCRQCGYTMTEQRGSKQ